MTCSPHYSNLSTNTDTRSAAKEAGWSCRVSENVKVIAYTWVMKESMHASEVLCGEATVCNFLISWQATHHVNNLYTGDYIL